MSLSPPCEQSGEAVAAGTAPGVRATLPAMRLPFNTYKIFMFNFPCLVDLLLPFPGSERGLVNSSDSSVALPSTTVDWETQQRSQVISSSPPPLPSLMLNHHLNPQPQTTRRARTNAARIHTAHQHLFFRAGVGPTRSYPSSITGISTHPFLIFGQVKLFQNSNRIPI
jgi:hypothetical protein